MAVHGLECEEASVKKEKIEFHFKRLNAKNQTQQAFPTEKPNLKKNVFLPSYIYTSNNSSPHPRPNNPIISLCYLVWVLKLHSTQMIIQKLSYRLIV